MEMPPATKSLLEDLEAINVHAALAFYKLWKEGRVANTINLGTSFIWANTSEGATFWHELYMQIGINRGEYVR